MVTGLQMVDGKLYLFDSNGIMQSGISKQEIRHTILIRIQEKQ